MYRIPLFSLAAANTLAVPNPQIRLSTPIPETCKEVQGTISLVFQRSNPNTPTELIIEFQPRRQTEFPHTNAPRTIRISLTGPNAGLGTYTRDQYVENGQTHNTATINICSDALTRTQIQTLERDTGSRVRPLVGSGLGQAPDVAGLGYSDIANLPIIRAYESHGNMMQGGQFEAVLTTLMRTLRE